MTIRCPKCRTPSLLHNGEITEVGRLERCPNCHTTWLARKPESKNPGRRGTRRRRQGAHRTSTIIEGHVIPEVRPTPPPSDGVRSNAGRRAGPKKLRFGRFAAAGAVTMLMAAVLLAPAVTALPNLAASLLGQDDMTLQGIRSRTIKLRGTDAILVEGEIYNESGREREVPAVRIALKEGGSEVYSWLLEPTVLRVGAGGKVAFRSAMPTPRPGVSQISLSLAGREGGR